MKLYIVPIGGLANRMRAVASGVALAEKTGRDPVVIWHRDKWLYASFSDIFLTESLPFELRETGWIKYNLLYEQPRKLNLFVSGIVHSFIKKKRIFQDNNRDYISDEKEIQRIVADSTDDVVIQSGDVFHTFGRSLLNDLFHPNDAVGQRRVDILGDEKPKYALQIRRTDNHNSISNSPLEAFEKVASKLVREDPECKIFLATDDEETKLHFRNIYPKNILINRAVATRRSVSGIVDAAAEMYIMASCSHIYGSYWSSFSEIAAMIGGCPLSVVRK